MNEIKYEPTMWGGRMYVSVKVTELMGTKINFEFKILKFKI